MHTIFRLGQIGLLMIGAHAHGATLNTVHEWGTFTSVMGSDGRKMEGLFVEEEKLPGFVYSYDRPLPPEPIPDPLPWPTRPTQPSRPGCNSKVGCRSFEQLGLATIVEDFLPRNPVQTGVTQKMETPVIYFYGEAGAAVNVQIDFPQGIISQWFPRATRFSPTPSELANLGPSQFWFDLKLMSENTPVNQVTNSESIWNPARQVAANTIAINGELEKFIFYRGVGDFDGALTVSSDLEYLTIESNYGHSVAMILLNFDGVKGEVINLGIRGEKTRVRIPQMQNGLDRQSYLNRAKKIVVSALLETGLFPDEALALVNTWEKSYFLAPGLRLLSLMPQDQVERILPLKINPKPNELVRVLVARLEILTKQEEEKVIKELVPHLGQRFISSTVRKILEKHFGRFSLPKGLRILELINDADSEIPEEQRTLADSQMREVLAQFR